ncbi:MAG: UDP-N-acetylmuramate dehydrogenase [Herpetosiphonaceae bacterium]|nr:UDP-N-acetylmuramate dehydrogenase [Herpetosiphonaceae bacterium]
MTASENVQSVADDQLVITENEPLAPYTAWRIGGPARWFTTTTTPAQLVAAARWADQRQLPLFVLGGGSNLLMSDAGWPGLVIRNRATDYHLAEHADGVLLHVAAGAPMAGTARKLAAQGLAGLEWAEGLPGTVGGAIYGNAGCYGGSLAQNLVSATLLMPDGSVETWETPRFAFDYRTSALKRLAANNPATRIPLVLEAVLRLQRDDPGAIAERIAAIASGRKSRTPAGSSCGSVFKNPAGTTAGTLIDRAGLKGLTVGAAQVAEKHANYIINLGGASAANVLNLAEQVREEVQRQFGIALELEVRVIEFKP